MSSEKTHRLAVEYLKIDELKPSRRNPRRHSKCQLTKLGRSLERFGFQGAILIDNNRNVLSGNALLEAAKLIGMKAVPTMVAATMSEADRRALIIALNRLAELADWDDEILREELQFLVEHHFDVDTIGFETPDLDLLFGAAEVRAEEPVEVPIAGQPSVSAPGDLWLIGEHRILCGDARDKASYERLLGGELAQLVLTDAPYNVPIAGHVSGLGKAIHREFAMASGEMSSDEFIAFLASAMRLLVGFSQPGSIHFHFIDWRHLREMLAAADGIYRELKNLCVWAKTNAGMGSFYRSQHELVFVFKSGKAPHINNFSLGEKGRYRSNVWSYAGVNTFRAGREQDLADHPTVKPVQMLADAILDCSHRGGIVLDAFAGSGATLVSAARTGRRGYGIEIDGVYVDVCIRRLEKETGETAVLESGETFSAIAARRLPPEEEAA